MCRLYAPGQVPEIDKVFDAVSASQKSGTFMYLSSFLYWHENMLERRVKICHGEVGQLVETRRSVCSLWRRQCNLDHNREPRIAGLYKSMMNGETLEVGALSQDKCDEGC